LTTKQYTKFQSYSYKDGQKKSEKLKKSEILLSSRGVTLAKINQSYRNANQKDGQEKSRKLKESEILLSFRIVTLTKINQSHRIARCVLEQ
jgi:hypothetical protein